ncbi:MAG TPA: LamG-like jellyroll fold domain-containing protein [Verrucomicrobiae bacterium]|nr:LamG-like jellyroll fold domain-containing protein [Verrucomicrobiae bacterium]
MSGLAILRPMPVRATESLSFGWEASTDTNVVGYNIYYGTASHVYTGKVLFGNVTTATISGLVEGTTYYFAATTYDALNQESDFSDEITYTVPVTITNQPPTIIEMLTTNTAIVGQNVTFSITATGTGPLTYQWMYYANKIASATNTVLTLNNVTAIQAGTYYVTVSNSAGSTNSSTANLAVYPTTAATLTPASRVNGQFALSVSGIANYQYVVEASTNLVDWVPVRTNISPFAFVDSNASQFNQRFYRTYYLPINTPTDAIYTDITSGLIAWYPLAGDLNDHFAGNNGTGNGTIAYGNGVNGVANTALVFDGTDTCVSIANLSNTITNSTTISIMGWVKSNDLASNYNCFGFRAPADGAGAFYIDTLSSGVYEARFRNSSGTAFTLGSTPVATNAWTFLGLVYDGSNIYFYTNGVLAQSTSASLTFGVGAQPFYIGGAGYSGPASNLPDFPMAGVRLYDRALSVNELGTLYTNGISGGIF